MQTRWIPTRRRDIVYFSASARYFLESEAAIKAMWPDAAAACLFASDALAVVGAGRESQSRARVSVLCS